MSLTPEEYDNWYYTKKGKYISGLEKKVLLKMIAPEIPPFPPLTKGGGGGILDIGCGTGYFTHFLGSYCRSTVGVDTSMDMIRYAVKKHKDSNIKYLIADAESLPFKNGSFDMAVSITSINFFKNPTKAISEAIRVSKVRIFLGVLNKWSLLYLFKKLKGFLSKTTYSDACFYSQEEITNILKSPHPPFLKGGRGGIKKVQAQHTYFLPFPKIRLILSGLERIIPSSFPFGGFMGVAGDIER